MHKRICADTCKHTTGMTRQVRAQPDLLLSAPCWKLEHKVELVLEMTTGHMASAAEQWAAWPARHRVPCRHP